MDLNYTLLEKRVDKLERAFANSYNFYEAAKHQPILEGAGFEDSIDKFIHFCSLYGIDNIFIDGSKVICLFDLNNFNAVLGIVNHLQDYDCQLIYDASIESLTLILDDEEYHVSFDKRSCLKYNFQDYIHHYIHHLVNMVFIKNN